MRPLVGEVATGTTTSPWRDKGGFAAMDTQRRGPHSVGTKRSAAGPLPTLLFLVLALGVVLLPFSCASDAREATQGTATPTLVVFGPDDTPIPSPAFAVPPTATPSPTKPPTFTRTPSPVRPTATADTAALDQYARQVLARTANLRGLQPKTSVPLGYLNKDELRARLAKVVEKDVSAEDLAKEKALYVVLGYVDPAEDLLRLYLDLLSEQVLGFYEFDTREMKVVRANGRTALSTLDELTLAHEYVHALQDQHFDIGARMKDLKGASERALALQALAEGDAVLAMAAYGQQYKTREELAQVQEQAGAFDQSRLDAAPLPIQAEMLFPYQQGAIFVASLLRSGGWAAVDKAFADPPRTSEQIMHPQKYLDGEDAERVALPDLGPALGPEWTRVGEDTLGELGWSVYFVSRLDPGRARRGADGWGGDSWAIYQRQDGRYAFAALSTWDDADEAGEFLDALRESEKLRSGVSATLAEPARFAWSGRDSGYASLKGTQVLLVVAPDEATVQKVTARFGGF